MKKKKMFAGFKTVFSFTTEQTVKGKGFKSATIGIFILIFLIMVAINIVLMVTTKEDEDKKDDDSDGKVVEIGCDLKELYVYGKLEFENIKDSQGNPVTIDEKTLNTAEILKELTGKEVTVTDKTGEISVTSVLSKEKAEEIRKKIGESLKDKENTAAVLMYIDEDKNVQLEFLELENENNYEEWEIGDKISQRIKEELVSVTGLSPDMVEAAGRGVVVTTLEAGEEKELAVILVKMLMPMFICLIVYMLVLINGQSITKAVMAEKTSKLLETLLTSVEPYAVITGKVMSMVLVALAQFFFWIAGGVAGFITGNIIAKNINPEFKNPVYDILDLIRNGAASAFSIQSVIMAILFVIVGFFMYCSLAAFSGAMADKAEDLSSSSTVFQLPVIISFLVVYFAPLMDNKILLFVSRYLPFTSPFSIPADVIVGNVSILESVMSLLLLVVFTFAVIVITGKTYKKRVFGKN